MSEQNEQHQHDVDGWPVPSRDVLRDLDRPAPVWPEPERDVAEPALSAA